MSMDAIPHSYEQSLLERYSQARMNLMAAAKAYVRKPNYRPKTWRHAPAPLPVAPVMIHPHSDRDYLIVAPIIVGADEGMLQAINSAATPQWKRIMLEICVTHQVTMNDLRSARRDRKVVAARHEAAFRMNDETAMTLHQIGYRLGGRDHTTILYAISRHKARNALV